MGLPGDLGSGVCRPSPAIRTQQQGCQAQGAGMSRQTRLVWAASFLVAIAASVALVRDLCVLSSKKFCKRIVEHHGGEIGVERGADSGSVFWFTLPEEEPA
jgi:hypothetical protein